MNQQAAPVALTIAGLDPSGGAGIIADVRTFVAFGCYPTAVITSLTYQNTTRVFGASHQSAGIVRQQVLPIIEDFSVAGVKTGMLPTREVISAVARLFRETELPPPVVDPVMQATSGDSLIDDAAVETLVRELFSLARVVTPNIPEAERLTGLTIRDVAGMERASEIIRRLGARAVLIKGGHTQETEQAIDLLNDEGSITRFEERRVSDVEIHGSGCTLSAGIAAGLGLGKELEAAIGDAKGFVTELIRNSVKLGHGAMPLYVPSNE
jgi:hydroxymethylpyrimidine kinase/phosphomethylpyrimidine kinase